MPAPDQTGHVGIRTLTIQGFQGLSLKLDWQNRPKESFQQLDNVDMYIPGTLRKVLPATVASGPLPVTPLNAIEYLAQPNTPTTGGTLRIIIVGADGKLYDYQTAALYLDTSALLGTPITIPQMYQVPGYFVPYNMRAWQASTAYSLNDAVLEYSPKDGILYVYYVETAGTSGTVEPIWLPPSAGTVTDGSVQWEAAGQPTSDLFYVNYLVINSPGQQPVRGLEYQWVPGSLTEPIKYYYGAMGCSPAEMPIEIGGQVITPNLNGYSPSAGRAYEWTFYNPNTLQESSPSPFAGKTKIVERDAGNISTTINGSILYPLPPPTGAGTSKSPTIYSSYQSYYLSIAVSALTPAIGQGYTCIRVYATQDGGTVFYLVNTLFDNKGNQISNGDGSIPIALLESLQAANGWQDYVPVPEAQVLQNSVRIYEGSGPINLAPDPVNLGPAAWTITPDDGGMYVQGNGAPDGSNSFQVDSPTTAKHTAKSSNIPVTPQTYYFQIYMDKTQGTGGTMSARIQTPSGTILLALTQADGVASTLFGTFTPTTAQKQIQIVIYYTGVTIATDSSVIWADPLLEAGPSFSTQPTNYPTPDQSLTQPAPLPFSNQPPPLSLTIAPYLDAMFFVDWIDRTKIWYSQQGGYEKLGINNYVRTTTHNGDRIMELIDCFDRLMIGKGRSVEQITSYPPTEPISVDPQHGVMAYRASQPYGSDELVLLTNGLNAISLTVALEAGGLGAQFSSKLIGDDIKPIIDSFNQNFLSSANLSTHLPSPAVLNSLDLFCLAYAMGNGYSENVLLRYVTGGGYTRLTSLPVGAQVVTLCELQTLFGPFMAPIGPPAPATTTPNIKLLALCSGTNTIYRLFGGTQDGTITATVVTQPLPTPADIEPDLWSTNKAFQTLWVEGEDLGNWQVYYTTELFFNGDGTVNSFHWGPFSIINNEVKLRGVPGKQIVFKFVHSAACAAGITPMLSYFKLAYTVQGER